MGTAQSFAKALGWAFPVIHRTPHEAPRLIEASNAHRLEETVRAPRVPRHRQATDNVSRVALLVFSRSWALSGWGSIPGPEGAISASRKMPHDAAAMVAAGGAGGVYGLKIGTMVHQPRYAYWFSKPNGMSYDELYAQATPLMDEGQDVLWMRQMVLGSAPEFCLQTSAPASFSSAISTRMLPLRVIWPQSPDATD